ncbi:MAG: DUF4190 domain-containing protein [Leucobacter sp.]
MSQNQPSANGSPEQPGQPQAPQYAAPPAPQAPQAPQYAAPQAPQYAAPQPQYVAPQQPYAAPQQAYAVAPPTNTLAIIALVGSFFISLVGVICGHIALKQIAQSGEGGRGLALAGLIIGYIGLALGTIYIIFMIVVFGSLAASSSY